MQSLPSRLVRKSASTLWLAAIRNGPCATCWSKDRMPGDKTGDGFNPVWHAARP